jgi:hypothetical protein
VKLLVAMKERVAGIVSHEVNLCLLKSAQHYDVFHDTGGRLPEICTVTTLRRKRDEIAASDRLAAVSPKSDQVF